MNNLSQSETGIVRRYLVALHGLEAAVPCSSENLDTDQAGVWTHNSDEVRDRERLFDSWCCRLCGFFGIPAGPALACSGIKLVV